MPLDFGGSRTSIEVAGYRPAPDEDMERNFVRVSAGYFGALGIPIQQGLVAAVNPSVPVIRAYSLLDQVERNIADERMAMAIGMALAIVALLLATAGLYATMAFLVGQRIREIGVRMALGARTTDVRSLVLREGVTLALLGVGGGLALSAWVGHALRHQLFDIGRLDVVSLVAAAAILSAGALFASWVPARRASRVDPVVALRES